MRNATRKTVMLAIAFFCLAMAAVGSLVPVLQGWIFLIIAIAIFAEESEIARGWMRAARRRWPGLSRHVDNAAKHPRAPRVVRDFARNTDPGP